MRIFFLRFSAWKFVNEENHQINEIDFYCDCDWYWLIYIDWVFFLDFFPCSSSSMPYRLSRIWAVSAKRQSMWCVKCPQKCQPPLQLKLNEPKTSQKIFIQISIGLKSYKRSSRWVNAERLCSILFGAVLICSRCLFARFISGTKWCTSPFERWPKG